MDTEIAGLERLERTLADLSAAMSAAGLRKLGLRIGQAARRANTARIGRNVAPDGSPFAPRKGKLRARMFRKLRTVRHLRLTRRADGIALSFSGRDARIARVHHFGLRDKPWPKSSGKTVKYAARPLLGLSRADLEAIEDVLLAELAAAWR
jgi:phage virion morphogenesis protein